MAASFASRLSGLRQTQNKVSQTQQGQGLRLTLPADQSERSSYEPSTTFSNTRTSFRLLKGRIDRGQSSDKPQISSSNTLQQRKQPTLTTKLSLPDEPKTQMKLTLNDDPVFDERKTTSEMPKVPLQKRILIAKEPPKQEPKREEPPRPPKREEPPLPPKKEEVLQKKESSHLRQEEKPIHEEAAEESLPHESENDLVMCPEGCGRKFNRKALQKHAKACKLVFMSKRKEFNSEAKRVVSKEQAAIVKQTKMEEKKKMGATRGKGFDKTKTGENWKAASEDFRAAIKAMKKDEGQQGEVDIEIDMEGKKANTVQCQHCQKQFSEVFIEQHIQNCPRRKDRDRSKKRPPAKK